MARNYYITVEEVPNVFKDQMNIKTKRTYNLRYSPWAETNGDVTTVNWNVINGQASVTGQSLASNLASAQIEATEEGKSLIEVEADTGTDKFIAYIDLYARDPNKGLNELLTDYL